MRVLVVGSGGREHALVWALQRSPSSPEVFAAPGNPGINETALCFPVDPADPALVAQLADDLDVDLVVVGPEGRWSRASPTRCGRAVGPASDPARRRRGSKGRRRG